MNFNFIDFEISWKVILKITSGKFSMVGWSLNFIDICFLIGE